MAWRDTARTIIQRVIKETGTDDQKKLKSALHAAYPFGPRQYHPYKIWCDEIRVQLGTKPIKPRKIPGVRSEPPVEGQKELF